VSNPQKSLRGISYLIADSNSYFSSLLFSMLKGFGADKIIQARDWGTAIEALTTSKVDVMLCDAMLPPGGGIRFVRGLRTDTAAPYRKIPILFMTSDGRVSTIKAARDAGANMIVMKPLSPKNLHERLQWVAFDARAFVETPTYYGPDRRFKIEGFPDGQGRRKGDLPVEVSESDGPALSQNDIDSLFADARNV
jgi:two-component system, chemotaxis family, chemotaxis protein CheY